MNFPTALPTISVDIFLARTARAAQKSTPGSRFAEAAR
jgi:hypothetical protein